MMIASLIIPPSSLNTLMVKISGFPLRICKVNNPLPGFGKRDTAPSMPVPWIPLMITLITLDAGELQPFRVTIQW